MAMHDLFKVSNFVMQLRDQKSIEFMNVEAPLPGFNIGTIEVPHQSMMDKRPGGSITFNDITLTVNCDEDLKAYKEIYDYLVLAHDPLTNKLCVKEEVFDGYLYLLTNKNNVQHKLHFYDMWIESVSDLQLETISADENNLTMTLGLKYNFFVFE
jgi:hypothetical protein